MHRRNFLASLNTLSLGMFLAPRGATFSAFIHHKSLQATSLRIAIFSVTNAPVNGVVMGKAEVSHAASLLNRNVHFIEVGASDDNYASVRQTLQHHEISALIGGGDLSTTAALSRASRDAGALFLNAFCAADALREDQCARHAFHVCASDRMKRDAVAAVPVSGGECVAWHSSLSRYGADTLNSRFRTQFKAPMTEADWNGWLAIKVAWETFLRARSGSSEALLGVLENGAARFDGHKGKALSFRKWDHQLRQPLYVLGGTPDTVEEIPSSRANNSTAEEALDQLGGTDMGRCTWNA